MINIIISKNYTILETMECFQVNNDRVALVEENNKIIGIVSQGDIIKSLVKGVSMQSRVDMIMIRNFKYLYTKDLEKAFKLFKKHKITMLPILSRDFKLVDTIVLNDIYRYLEEKQ